MKLFQQELLFAKVAPVQSITDIVLLGFSLILLPGMFISYYTIIYFFVKNFFSNVYILVNTIFECSYSSFGGEIGHPLSMHVIRGMEGVHPKCLQMRTGRRKVSRFMCTYALALTFFMFLFYGVLFYLQKFNLTFIQKRCVCQKWLFFSSEMNFCCNEISVFYFELFLQTKVSQNALDFSQIESQIYSIFQCDFLL